ncbi:alkaline phosphatase [Kineococcus rhizosphaerae]|uniref:Alkaline phosphatase n=1 Tax=Kineococcus rhizosphaerae TaxID=559628 RepID=A0A2T0R2Y5_9ACTN|nr:alkaline phosphatase [Kineococcus rhizosphaerae]PRY14177.1 alkaline phosphatase [Kineococcus rhizosphaerae]
MTDPQSSTNDENPQERRGFFTRRGLLGTGGLATAVVFGKGLVDASAASAAPAYVPAQLNVKDAHYSTTLRRVARSTTSGGSAVKVLPIDRAKFQVGAKFDLRIEATGVDPETTKIVIKVSDGHGPAPMLSPAPIRTSSAPDSVEVTFKDLVYPTEGSYTIAAAVSSSKGSASQEVTHEVVLNEAEGKKAKNVIFFLGDGMGQAAITGARILSKGITEGKYDALLEMDTMDFRGNVTTSGADSIATDSANSMSAYMTGHKSSVNAMGVYAGNSEDPTASPHVETLAEILKRAKGMSVGIVTTAEVQDATPAAVFAHTRRRSEYVSIMDQALQPGQMPDVYMGGGRATFLPQSEKGSKRKDDRNLIEEFKDKGFAYAGTRTELAAVMAAGTPDKLLGTFTLGNLNVYIDRQITPNPEVLGDFPDQPGLVEMTKAALKVLEKNDKGFFLMVEGASIDKSEHPLDGPRAVYDTIELDQAIAVAKEWSKENGEDTLIVITADHNHAMSIAGTHTLSKEGSPARQQNGVYADAGFPTYVDANGDGFPDDPNPDVQLFFGWSNHPDHPDDFAHNAVLAQPALEDPVTERAYPNPARDPGSVVQIGNLPLDETNCVHTVEDVFIGASGPGAQGFAKLLDNTEVFHTICAALGLQIPTYVLKSSAAKTAQAEVAAQAAAPVG